MTISTVIFCASQLWLAGWVIRQQRVIRRLKTERAERAAELLLGHTRVDGYDVPLPTDPRWTCAPLKYGRDEVSGLHCGPVRMTRSVMAIGPVATAVPAVPSSSAVRAYIDAVWREHANRLVREAAP